MYHRERQQLDEQAPSHAWDATISDALCATRWQMADLELKLMKRATLDWDRAGFPLPRIAFEIIPEVETILFHVLSTDERATAALMSVSWSNRGKPFKLRHDDISRALCQGTAERLICFRLPAKDRQKYGEDKVGKLIKNMYGTHTRQLDFVNLTCGEPGGIGRGKHGGTWIQKLM